MIKHSEQEDIETIFSIYKMATDYQKTVPGAVAWPEFERDMVVDEIKEQRQWKLIIDGKIACVWAITFDDPEIWGAKNADPSMYVHRLAVHDDFKGKNMAATVFEWAKTYASAKEKEYLRLDTVGYNEGLIGLYQKHGFKYLGLTMIKETQSLPIHYQNAEVCLFEMILEPQIV